jgi:CheY-like chemotaxis protein
MTISPARPTTPIAILVADDDETERESVSDILRTEGYVVVEADDGATALTILETKHFDALVLDDRMPELDGMAVLAAAENSPPAVIMSTHDVDSMGGKDLVVRGISYLHKPVDPEHLLDAVATAVGRGRHS